MKYEVKMSCGHTETVVLFGKESDRERKIYYYETVGLCKECFKKKMREQEETEGLLFKAAVLPDIDEKNGDILLNVWFSGNTRPSKDNIKSLGGYSWSEREAADDSMSFGRMPLCWNKIININELEEEVAKAISIGADNATTREELLASIDYQIASRKQKEWNEEKRKIDELEKPIVPEVLKGCKWNRKIYGKEGNYSFYPDGVKSFITDEQAAEIENYLEKVKEYRKKVEEIKNA